MSKIKVAEHLYEIYPSMPRYANDPEESDVVKIYDFILRRFVGFYGKQPKYFVKGGASPLLFGDHHDYVDFPYYSFSSTQDIVIAIAPSSSSKIRINNYQTAMYGEKVIESRASQWKFDQKDEQDRFTNIYTKILTIVSDELKLQDLGGLDILVYCSYEQDDFMSWKQNLFCAFYVAVTNTLNKGKSVEVKQIYNTLKELKHIDQQIVVNEQITNYKVGVFSMHNIAKQVDITFPKGLNIVIAHSLTPLPKKLTQGKRFNLRRCQILIAIEYLKIAAGTTKQIKSLKQLQEFIGCSTEELIKQIQENIPQGKLSPEDIQQFTQQSLIDILKQVPYANSVIDQNNQYYPRNRALFFLKEQLLVRNLTQQNLVHSVKQSYQNQLQLLNIGSEQIEQVIEAGSSFSLGHRIIGNGWGGNVIFFCEKAKCSHLVTEIINKFYLNVENKVLLSDDIDQYIHVIQQPSTGLLILDPENQIWF